MTLAEYLTQLKGDTPYDEIGRAIGRSAAAVYNIASGKTLHPGPDMLEGLARYFGKTGEEQRRIYAELMHLAGYFELLPEAMLEAFPGSWGEGSDPTSSNESS